MTLQILIIIAVTIVCAIGSGIFIFKATSKVLDGLVFPEISQEEIDEQLHLDKLND